MPVFKFQGQKVLKANFKPQGNKALEFFPKINSADKPQLYIQNNLELSKLMMMKLKSSLITKQQQINDIK